MQILLLVLVAALVGAASSVQSGTNGTLAGRIGLPATILISASVLAVGAAGFWLVARRPAPWPDEAPPWYLFLGGLYGLCIITGLAFAFPRLGAGPTTAVMIASQLTVVLLMDHFGILCPRTPVSPIRVLGAVLLATGAVLVLWPKLFDG